MYTLIEKKKKNMIKLYLSVMDWRPQSPDLSITEAV